MAAMRDRLKAEKAQFEQEQRLRQEAELEADRIRMTQDIEKAAERKQLEEARQEKVCQHAGLPRYRRDHVLGLQEKETKRNQEAKNRWIRERELQQQLKASEDQLAAERAKADQARKELTKAQLVEKEAKRRNTLADGDTGTGAERADSPEDANPLSKQIQELVALMKHDTIDESLEGGSDDEGEFDEDDEGEFDDDEDGTDHFPSQTLESGEATDEDGEAMPSQALEEDSTENDASDVDEPEPATAAGNGHVDPVEEPSDDEDDEDDVIDLMSHTGSKAMSRNDSSNSLANNPFLSTPESPKKPPTPSNDAFNPFAPTAPNPAAVSVPTRRHSAGNSGEQKRPAGRLRGDQRAASVSNSEAAIRLAQRKVNNLYSGVCASCVVSDWVEKWVTLAHGVRTSY
jgi:hypothetical protein